MLVKNGAKAIVLGPDKILLFHRDDISTIPYPDYWQIPGGGIEKGETPEEGVRRELQEEASYVPEKCYFLGKVRGSYGEDVFGFVFFVEKAEEDNFTIGPDEGQEVGFFTLDEALKLKITDQTRLFLEKGRILIERTMKERKIPDKKMLAYWI